MFALLSNSGPHDDMMSSAFQASLKVKSSLQCSLSVLFFLAHSQVMNEYRGGEMSTEVVVDRNLWTEIVDRRRK